MREPLRKQLEEIIFEDKSRPKKNIMGIALNEEDFIDLLNDGVTNKFLNKEISKLDKNEKYIKKYFHMVYYRGSKFSCITLLPIIDSDNNY